MGRTLDFPSVIKLAPCKYKRVYFYFGVQKKLIFIYLFFFLFLFIGADLTFILRPIWLGADLTGADLTGNRSNLFKKWNGSIHELIGTCKTAIGTSFNNKIRVIIKLPNTKAIVQSKRSLIWQRRRFTTGMLGTVMALTWDRYFKIYGG